MYLKMVPMAFGALALAAAAEGAVISIDTSELDASGGSIQPVVFSVSGGENVSGVNFFVMLTGPGALPVITDIDLRTGTVFSSYPAANEVFFPLNDQVAYATVSGDTVTLNPATLARVYVDLSGFSGSSFGIQITEVSGSDTDFIPPGGVGSIGITGETFAQISVVPEPATLGLLGAAAMFAIRRRRA